MLNRMKMECQDGLILPDSVEHSFNDDEEDNGDCDE